MNANLQLTPVRIDLPLMKPEGWQIMPPVDFASDEGKELKEGPQPMLCDKRRAAFVTKLDMEVGTSIKEATFALAKRWQ